MALYDIEYMNCLGISHYGEEYVESSGVVELTDDDAAKIIELIRKEGTSDIEALKLKEVYPDIYKKLDEAYYKMAYDAEELYWLRFGYENDGCDCDYNELMEYCKENCGFKFEYNEKDYIKDGKFDEGSMEDDEIDAFDEWLNDYIYSLDDDEARDFLKNKMGDEVNLDEITYEVAIPEEIIEMAEKKD